MKTRRTFWSLASLVLLFGACSSDDGGGSPKKPTKDSGVDASDAATDTGTDTSDAAETGGTPTVLLPKVGLEPEELGVLVNTSDPLSVEIASYYVSARGIPSANVVELSFTVGGNVMDEAEFQAQKAIVDAQLPATVQALLVTWMLPYRVSCMGLTTAFALGFDTKYCNTTGGGCGPTASIDFFDSESVAPFTDHGIRPTMMLAASDITKAKALIDRGIASDDTHPTGDGYLMRTTDQARSVRWPAFVGLTQSWDHPEVMKLTYLDNSDGSGMDYIENQADVLFYFTGLASVPAIETLQYRPGAVADHLTSFGGQVPTASGQMSVLSWLEAGATASYGTTVEPCNYTNKFPDPRVLVPWYYRGATVLEAYWKSVAAPGEGSFVGEPLARPWRSAEIEVVEGALEITTTALDPAHTYRIESADTEAGPFTPVQAGITLEYHQPLTLVVPPPLAAVYRVVAE
jgi:uncharacterized protein (TIGR03790 family)